MGWIVLKNIYTYIYNIINQNNGTFYDLLFRRTHKLYKIIMNVIMVTETDILSCETLF